MRITVFGIVLSLLVQPAVAECFTGKPQQMTYDKGRVIAIIQRHGDDLTYTEPYEGFQDTVNKSRMMLFPLTARAGARSTEYRWSSKLPKAKQMVPGYHFSVSGMMKSGDGKALPYRVEGDVTAADTVMLGACPYAVAVVRASTFLNDAPLSTGTYALSTEMMVVLQSTVVSAATGKPVESKVVALQ